MSALSSAALLLMALLPGPNAAPGWVRGGDARCYSPDALYEYIDGAADLYLSYGFKQAVVGDYVKSGEGEHWITVDVYDMGAPLHAFGIYGAEKPPDVAEADVGEYGMQGYSLEGLTTGGPSSSLEVLPDGLPDGGVIAPQHPEADPCQVEQVGCLQVAPGALRVCDVEQVDVSVGVGVARDAHIPVGDPRAADG